MAVISTHRNSLNTYKRYLKVIADRPLLQASLFLVFSLVLLIILIATALRPTLITIFGLVGSIQKQQEIETKMTTKIQNLVHAQQLLSEIQPQLTFADMALPNENTFAYWVEALKQITLENKVSLTKVGVDGNGKYSLAVLGEYPDLYRFLDAFERLRRLSIIETVHLAKTTMVISGTLPYDLD